VQIGTSNRDLRLKTAKIGKKVYLRVVPINGTICTHQRNGSIYIFQTK
jgi:hypothetical protein